MKQHTRRGPDEWERIFTEQSKSGLGVKAFCARERIAPSSFYNRLRKLQLQDMASDASVGPAPFIDMGGIAGDGLVSQNEPALMVTLDLGYGVTLTLRRS